MKATHVLSLLPDFNPAEDESDLSLILEFNHLKCVLADTVAEFVPKGRHSTWRDRFYPEDQQ